MANIPKKTIERYIATVSKFQKILQTARDRDVNEADTVAIVQDILGEVFGFEKYLDITTEYAVRSTYCDLAIKTDGNIQYLVEVKAVGLPLKDSHLRQVVDYCANHGAQWAVLTNGINWELYKVRFERPIEYDMVSSLNFLEINPRKADDQEKLFVLSKEGLSKSAREDYYERVQSVNRFVIGALVLSDSVIAAIRRDLKKMASGLKVEDKEIEQILRNEILKRDVIEGDEASKALSRVRKALRKLTRSTTSKTKETVGKPLGNTDAASAALRTGATATAHASHGQQDKGADFK